MQLADACRENLKSDSLAASCEHGIGHGVLEYFGHENLVRALEGCRKIAKNPQSGCYKGVFMEYNVPSVLEGGKNNRIRYFDESNPFDPCYLLENEFRYACYFQLPQWWEKVMNEDYGRIGVLCNEVSDAELKDACYKGVGNVAAPSSEYNVAETLKKCKSITHKRGEVLCRIIAARGFLALEEHRSKAENLCLGLADEFRFWCHEDSLEIE
jgi:hypothetical protein